MLITILIYNFFELAYVSGESMLPTCEEGDILLVKKWKEPKRDDIVTAYIEELDCVVVKRVIGIGGDRICVAGDAIYRNGILLKKYEDCENCNSRTYEIDIPEGCVFLLGDNWKHSTDSRSFGCVAMKEIRGVVVEI